MATYTEIYDNFRGDSPVRHKIFVACQILSNTILLESAPSTNRKGWAFAARDNPEQTATEVTLPVLIENIALTLAQISSASDSAILTAVTTQVNRRYGAT